LFLLRNQAQPDQPRKQKEYGTGDRDSRQHAKSVEIAGCRTAGDFGRISDQSVAAAQYHQIIVGNARSTRIRVEPSWVM